MNQHRSNHGQHSRPPLEWEVLAVYEGPEPVLDPKMPERVREKAKRIAACQVSMASAGFDHRNNIDRVKFSYKLGFMDNGRFAPTSHIPDERVAEFVAVLQKASAEAKVVHANAVKKTKGQLAAAIGEQIKSPPKVP